MPDLPHLRPQNTSNKEPYSPRAGRGGFKLPVRQRAEHGAALQSQLSEIRHVIPATDQVILQFESDPGFDRLNATDNDEVAVCLLDTGVNREHPLLSPALH